PSGSSSLRRTSNKVMLSSATACSFPRFGLIASWKARGGSLVKPPDLHHVLGHYPRTVAGYPARVGPSPEDGAGAPHGVRDGYIVRPGAARLTAARPHARRVAGIATTGVDQVRSCPGSVRRPLPSEDVIAEALRRASASAAGPEP